MSRILVKMVEMALVQIMSHTHGRPNLPTTSSIALSEPGNWTDKNGIDWTGGESQQLTRNTSLIAFINVTSSSSSSIRASEISSSPTASPHFPFRIHLY